MPDHTHAQTPRSHPAPFRHARTRFAGVRWVVVGLVLAGGLAGCESERDRLEKVYAQASTSRSGAAAALKAQWTAGEITANEAINLAHERLEKVGDGASVDFAGSVLDFLKSVEGDLAKKELNEFFWIRNGTLAGSAGAAAVKLGQARLAEGVMLAGPARWQNDAYWRNHPDHDAMVSIVLHSVGRTREALDRISTRREDSEQVKQAYDIIQRDAAKRRP